jgi:DNA-binding SARP family transcriptional activator
MDFRLLGPVEVHTSAGPLDGGSPRQLCVLAALAVDAGRPVPRDTLIERVWGPDPPDQARQALYVYLARIRGLLRHGVGSGAGVLRRRGGYLLDVQTDQVDVHRFRRLVTEARARGCSDQHRAALLRQAIGMWSGPPLGGISSDWATRVRDGWQQEHLDVLVAWAAAELRLGNAAETLVPLREQLARSPYSESLVTALMRALAALGRGAEALDCYAQARRRLADGLGADPGKELQALHQALLRGGPDAGVPAVWSAGAARAVPNQLPLDIRGFTDRDRERDQLDALVAASGPQPAAAVVVVVSGTAGVGKTALAVHWAHRIREQFPDGQLYANLRGFDLGGVVANTSDTLRGFLDALGVSPQQIPAGLQAQVGLYRSQIANRRMLILLDNARDAEQVRPLLPGAPGCLVLVTSRERLGGLVAAEAAHLLTLDVFTPTAARNLLSRRLGAARLVDEPTAVDQIITRCAGLPLALTIVAARAADHTGFPLGAIAEELGDPGSGLDGFADIDPANDIRTVFSWSYHALSRPAARLFRLLGLHPGPDLSRPAAASLAGIPVAQAQALLSDLTRARLITEHVPGRYTYHDLLRAYAAELARTHDTQPEREAALHRIFDHYLHSAHAADRLLDPFRESVTPPAARPGVVPEHLADHSEAMAWFTAEFGVLLTAISRAEQSGFDAHAWHLTTALADFFERRGHLHDMVAAHRSALKAVQRLGDPTGHAHTHRGLGRAYAVIGRRPDANRHCQRALELFRELGDLVGQAQVHRCLAVAASNDGDHAEALSHAHTALDLFRTAGHQIGHAKALNAIGWYHAMLDHHHQALTYCQQALTAQRKTGDRYGQADAWDSLGYAHYHLGHHAEAITCYRHAVDLYQQLGHRFLQAQELDRLGDAYHAVGGPDAAHGAWRQALTIFSDIGHSAAVAVENKLRPRIAANR